MGVSEGWFSVLTRSSLSRKSFSTSGEVNLAVSTLPVARASSVRTEAAYACSSEGEGGREERLCMGSSLLLLIVPTRISSVSSERMSWCDRVMERTQGPERWWVVTERWSHSVRPSPSHPHPSKSTRR